MRSQLSSKSYPVEVIWSSYTVKVFSVKVIRSKLSRQRYLVKIIWSKLFCQSYPVKVIRSPSVECRSTAPPSLSQQSSGLLPYVAWSSILPICSVVVCSLEVFWKASVDKGNSAILHGNSPPFISFSNLVRFGVAFQFWITWISQGVVAIFDFNCLLKGYYKSYT